MSFQLECLSKCQLLRFWSQHPTSGPALGHDPNGLTPKIESFRRVTKEFFLHTHINRILLRSARKEIFFWIENENANVNFLFKDVFFREEAWSGRKAVQSGVIHSSTPSITSSATLDLLLNLSDVIRRTGCCLVIWRSTKTLLWFLRAFRTVTLVQKEKSKWRREYKWVALV